MSTPVDAMAINWDRNESRVNDAYALRLANESPIAINRNKMGSTFKLWNTNIACGNMEYSGRE